MLSSKLCIMSVGAAIAAAYLDRLTETSREQRLLQHNWERLTHVFYFPCILVIVCYLYKSALHLLMFILYSRCLLPIFHRKSVHYRFDVSEMHQSVVICSENSGYAFEWTYFTIRKSKLRLNVNPCVCRSVILYLFIVISDDTCTMTKQTFGILSTSTLP